MPRANLRFATKALLLCTAFALLQACSPTHQANVDPITAAYNSSGTVSVKPYSRTIFSSYNF